MTEYLVGTELVIGKLSLLQALTLTQWHEHGLVLVPLGFKQVLFHFSYFISDQDLYHIQTTKGYHPSHTKTLDPVQDSIPRVHRTKVTMQKGHGNKNRK